MNFSKSLLLSLALVSSAWARPEIEILQHYNKIESAMAVTKKDSLSLTELRTLYKHTIKNKVADLDRLSGYDPSGAIGFCFGRAMTAHLNARSMGLARTSLSKLFIIGDMRSDHSMTQPEWYFHVTTLVKGPDNTLYAIDPVLYDSWNNPNFTPPTVKEWIIAVRKGWDSWHGDARRARLVHVSADAVLPDLREFTPENKELLVHPEFDFAKAGLRSSDNTLKDFKLDKQSGESVYPLTLVQMRKHFIAVREKAADRFKFDGLGILGETFSYNNYFDDLMVAIDEDSALRQPSPDAGAKKIIMSPLAVPSMKVSESQENAFRVVRPVAGFRHGAF